MKILFLAPLKPPDHPVPSGERTMARLFQKLLGQLGYEVELASHLRTLTLAPSPAAWDELCRAARGEVERILAQETDRGSIACVFTYHVYYKAPDLIGPALAQALGVPYVIAEASRAPKRAVGSYAEGHRLSEAAISRADLVLTPTRHDREMLEAFRPPHQRIVDLRPFVDLGEWPLARSPRSVSPSRDVRLITVAMMREGDKLASYRQLAVALAGIADRPWRLTVVGDGPARKEVEALFAPFGDRVRFLGAISERPALGRLLAAADLFVWPGVNEAFGAVYLEAQAHGLPCVAASYGGIPDVIRDGETGRLSPPDDITALAANLAELIDEPPRRASMAAAAARFIAEDRDLSAAANLVGRAFADAGIPVPMPGPLPVSLPGVPS
ncbi:glycosyltransferase family 4 protein [Ancylobacter sonchi]|uniref:glycosyltransferase family 4 protein n=1 Tax=Ancylobacter sonchi TaxID=1937790 RepID=UPI001BD48040|nr:glycosyltransferase family 4 protein [Ancylobacter sonchi]MBS7535465.1 glycosyltransferase family 4 protein [Ancylobacter sonchi]